MYKTMDFPVIFAIMLIQGTGEVIADDNLERIITLMEASQNAMSFLATRQNELRLKLDGIENTLKDKIDGLVLPKFEHIDGKQDAFLTRIDQMETKLFDLLLTQGQQVVIQNSKTDEKITSVNSNIQQTLAHFSNRTMIIDANVASINSKLTQLNNENLKMELSLKLLNNSILNQLENINNHTLVLMQKQNSGAGEYTTTGGCGEVIIKEKGTITFAQDFVGDFICVWTVRVNRNSSAAFQLRSLEGSAIVTLTAARSFYEDTPKQELYWSSQQIIQAEGHRKFIVDGPTVFVTLSGKKQQSSGPIKMELYFEGRGDNSTFSNFYHYHQTTSMGDCNYPKDRGSTNYTAEEFASFVINPRKMQGDLYISLSKLNLETTEDCGYDSLSFGKFDKETARFERVGPCTTKYRYCHPLDQFPTTIGSTNSPWIIVFKSDDSNERDGFRFNWFQR